MVLAAHQSWIDDPPRRESSDEPRHPHLAEIGIDLDFREDRPMRVHREVGLRTAVRGAAAAGLDLVQAGATEDVGVALAATFIVAAMQAAAARHDASVAGAE